MGRQNDAIQHREMSDYNLIIIGTKENDDNKALTYVKRRQKRE